VTTLRQGDHGPRVVELQSALNAAGALPALATDGAYGPRTVVAVTSYQLERGLTVDGIAGPRTLAALGFGEWDGLPPVVDPRAIPTRPEGWIVGVDLSDAQGAVDGEALARAGVSFAWLKVSDGEHDGQRHAAENARRLDAAGIALGFYGVLEPYGRSRVETQVANFCRRSREIVVDPTLPAWCDFELARGESGAVALETAAAWCELAQVATGTRPMVYTGPAFVATLAKMAGPSAAPILARLSAFPLAVAHYGPSLTHGPMVPAPWPTWTVWQYSGDPDASGQAMRPWSCLPGTRTPVDVDFFRGTIEDLRALGKVET